MVAVPPERRGAPSWLWSAMLSVGLLCSCRDHAAGDASTTATAAVPSAVVTSSSAGEPASKGAAGQAMGDAARWRSCRARIEALRQREPSPGAAAFDAERVQMVGRVRGAAVIWKREPRHGELSSEQAEAVERLESSDEALETTRRLIRKFRRSPATLRAIFLREGYLYLRGTEVALAAVQQLGLPNLFRESTLYLLRDGTVHELRRQRHGRRTAYVHADGALKGERAEILFADRVGLAAGELTEDPLTVDLSAARQRHGFERLRKLHLSDGALAAEVRYGQEMWVPALFEVGSGRARLECHALDEANAGAARAAHEEAVRAARVYARLRTAAAAQVREQLPFDAPRGSPGDPADKYPLRARWLDAYGKSMRSFRFQERSYDVYDEQGRPLVPQVCIDFIYDTWERAAGTWYAPMKRSTPDGPLEPAPQRKVGTLDLDRLDIEQRRRVSKFLDFVARRSDLFDVWETPEDDQALFVDHAAFFSMLAKHADRIRRGDVLVVRRVRSQGRALHHNLMVMDTDLLTGVPTLLVGNSARPRLQTFDGVMQITPRRYLQLRIRPKASWLGQALLQADEQGIGVP